MKNCNAIKAVFLIFNFLFLFILQLVAQPIFYNGKFNQLISREGIAITTSIFQHTENGKLVYQETSKISTDHQGNYQTLIGNGQLIKGNIDSVIWSDGAYFLKIETDTSKNSQPYFKHLSLLRAPTDYNNEHLEGIYEFDSSKGWGTIIIDNKKYRKPKKITVDLSTSYVNVSYPADAYPIFRHYEWYDENADGLGNSFVLTYSEKTCHEFWEQTKKMGEIRLYPKPFQELIIGRNDQMIELLLTKPIEIKNLNQTYAIKGPSKIIYFIEW